MFRPKFKSHSSKIIHSETLDTQFLKVWSKKGLINIYIEKKIEDSELYLLYFRVQIVEIFPIGVAVKTIGEATTEPGNESNNIAR